jgi:hypothetical protein
MIRDLSICCYHVWSDSGDGHRTTPCGAPSTKFFLIEIDGQKTVQPLCDEHSDKDPAPWGREITRDEAIAFSVHLS